MALLAGAYFYGKNSDKAEGLISGSEGQKLPQIGPPPTFSPQLRGKIVDEFGVFKDAPTRAIENALLTSSLQQVEGLGGLLTFRLIPLTQQSALDFVNLARTQGATVFASLSCVIKGQNVERLIVIANPGQSLPTVHLAQLNAAKKKEAAPEKKAKSNGNHVAKVTAIESPVDVEPEHAREA